MCIKMSSQENYFRMKTNKSLAHYLNQIKHCLIKVSSFVNEAYDILILYNVLHLRPNFNHAFT